MSVCDTLHLISASTFNFHLITPLTVPSDTEISKQFSSEYVQFISSSPFLQPPVLFSSLWIFLNIQNIM